MTSLIAWVGVDSHGSASAYFASDSRITWAGKAPWDNGRKLFACRRYPHILGYCGDMFFPTQTLSQIVEMIDADLLIKPSDTVDECTARIGSIMEKALTTYPISSMLPFEVLYGMRQGDGMPSHFHLRQLSFKHSSGIRIASILIPQESQVVVILGSGERSVRSHLSRWTSSDVGGTSRAAFSAFCDALRSNEDALSGGPPQLVGLWRIRSGRTFGTLWHERLYYYGTEVDPTSPAGDVRWYNELFEICDPVTMKRKDGAQPQPRPRSVQSNKNRP